MACETPEMSVFFGLQAAHRESVRKLNVLHIARISHLRAGSCDAEQLARYDAAILDEETRSEDLRASMSRISQKADPAPASNVIPLAFRANNAKALAQRFQA